MKKIIFPCIVFLLLLSVQSFGQDVSFSQLYANPMYLNPAFAGTGTSQRIGMNYRNEWPGITGNDVTYNLSYDRNFIDSSNGIGILANREISGYSQEYTTYSLSIIYSHQFHIKSFTVSAGMQATYWNKSIDPTKIIYPDPIIGSVWPETEWLLRTSVSEPDFSGGVLVYRENYFAGFSVSHFTQYDESFTDVESFLRTKYIFNAGAMFHIRSITLSPTVLFENQGTFHQQEFEGYLTKGHLTAGVGFSFQEQAYNYYIEQGPDYFWWNDMNFTIGYQCKLFHIGYSYYTDLSKLTLATAGTHEGSLAFLIPYKLSNRHKVNGINCPSL